MISWAHSPLASRFSLQASLEDITDFPLQVSKEDIVSSLKFIFSLSPNQLDVYLSLLNSVLVKLLKERVASLEEYSRRKLELKADQDADRDRETAEIGAKLFKDFKDLSREDASDD